MKLMFTIISVAALSVSTFGQSGKQPVNLRLKDLHGQSLSLSDYRGKVLLVNFWATWCIPCRTEIPDLIKKQQKYRDRDLRILGITYPPETLTDVKAFARKNGMNYRVALGDKATKALFEESETLPISVVINRDGTVHDVIEGIMYQDEFDEKVKPLLSLAQTPSARQRRRASTDSTQRFKIVVGAEGYRPSSVVLRRAAPAQLTFIRNVEESCGREIVIPTYGINRPLPLNTPVVIRFTPTKSGRFKFTCGMDMFRGSIVVR